MDWNTPYQWNHNPAKYTCTESTMETLEKGVKYVQK